MERWLSWSKAHDWKSCVPYKGTEGSNPSLSANRLSLDAYCVLGSFFIEMSGLHFSQSKRTTLPQRRHPLDVFFFVLLKIPPAFCRTQKSP